MRPSKFIYNSDYATLQNDDKDTIQLALPASFSVPQNTIIAPFEASKPIGSKATCMRFNLSSDKYPGKSITSPKFNIPATYTDSTQSYQTSLIGYVYNTSNGLVVLRVDPSYPAGQVGTATYTDIGQTLSLKVTAFLSPFES